MQPTSTGVASRRPTQEMANTIIITAAAIASEKQSALESLRKSRKRIMEDPRRA